MTTPERVFDGDLLQARLWLPDRPTTALYVTFRHWQPEPGQFDAQGCVQRALAAGLAHLHVQSRWNDWFLNPETPVLEAALGFTRARFRTARALGFSMGAYAALCFSKALRLNQALLVAPQISLHLPGEDRYPEAASFDPRAGDLATRARLDLKGVVAFDPFHPLDRQHARAITTLLPGIRPAPLPFGGHPGTAAIGQAGGFRALQRLSLSSRLDAPDVVRLHRDLRATSARYWRERAHHLLRTNRPDLAEALADAATA